MEVDAQNSISLEHAKRVYERIETLGAFSEESFRLTRTFYSKPHREAADQIRSWMDATGMKTAIDPMLNVQGIWNKDGEGRRSIHVGSHYDTVIGAGKFDGPLGILLGIAVVEYLQEVGYQPRHPISIIAFSDEEGARFHTTFLGSAYLTGWFQRDWLQRRDKHDVSIEQLLRAHSHDADEILNAPARIRANDIYLETHIEQGTILEKNDMSVGIVDSIAAQMRIEVEVTGRSEHAGTTPGSLRTDALCGASEMVLVVEALGKKDDRIRATVGYLHVQPNASNVIPGRAAFTLDLRYPYLERAQLHFEELEEVFKQIAVKRNLALDINVVQQSYNAVCSPILREVLGMAARKHQGEVLEFMSGAGHDAMMIARTCRMGMLFVRCKEGLSHHPNEHVTLEDTHVALKVLADAIRITDQISSL